MQPFCSKNHLRSKSAAMNKFYKTFSSAIIFLFLFSFLGNQAFSQQTIKKGVPGACGYGGTSVLKNPSPMNGSGSFNSPPTISLSMCGLNYVAATQRIETRYDPYTTAGNYGCGLPCSWAISGLPTCIIPQHAYVYANVSYTEASPPVASITITNPVGNTQTYSASAIGTSVPKCWGETGTAAYRWDVTASIASNGSYSFNFSGFSNQIGRA